MCVREDRIRGAKQPYLVNYPSVCTRDDDEDVQHVCLRWERGMTLFPWQQRLAGKRACLITPHRRLEAIRGSTADVWELDTDDVDDVCSILCVCVVWRERERENDKGRERIRFDSSPGIIRRLLSVSEFPFFLIEPSCFYQKAAIRASTEAIMIVNMK